jgi:hypothetical protein
MNITIDPEFKALIPPLAAEELAQLRSNIITEGCRDPLVTWRGVIIDGHNRFEICTTNGIEFKEVTKDFDERSSAIEWIIRNQFGRRNLSPYERTRLALRLEEAIKERAKANMVKGTNQHSPKQNSAEASNPIETREEIAKLAGVSRDTVDKVKQIEKSAAPEIKEALANGEISINKAHLTVKAKKEEEEPEPLIVDGTTPTRRAPMKVIEDEGMNIWLLAKSHLDRINKNDTQREDALKACAAYCAKRLESKK